MGVPHLIAVDLDGTLLTEKKTITDRTKKVLQKVQEEGHQVVISTGRAYRASYMYYKQLNLKTPIVNFNGSYVHHPLDSSFQAEHAPIDLAVTREIVHSVKEMGMKNMIAESLGKVYAHRADISFQELMSMGEVGYYEGDLLQTLKESPVNLLITTEEERVEDVHRHLSDAHGDAVFYRNWGVPHYAIEVMKSGISKATGLMRVSAHLGIPRERIIAFGDENNDLEMIDYVGHGVAMGNGISELKALANDVTVSNEQDGVARYLENYFNL